MRNFLIALIIMMVAKTGMAQQNKSITKIAIATYDGDSTEGYYFTNELDEGQLFFNNARLEVLKIYNLKDKSNLRESFRVTYNIDSVEGKKIMTIINLEKLDYDSEDDGSKG